MHRLKSRWMFWFDSGQRQTMKSRYLTSVMLGHARAEGIVKEMLGVPDKLAIPLRWMLSLGMDGPNVNKSRIHNINQVKKEKGDQPLVKCPASCLTDICYNIFQNGMVQYGYNVEELCLNLFEIEESLGLEELIVLCHVQNQ